MFISLSVFLMFIGFASGWIMRGGHQDEAVLENTVRTQLRLKGSRLVQPLLLCDTTPGTDPSQALQTIERALDNAILKGKEKQRITTASIYYRDLKTGGQVYLNQDESFFPSSLRKVPLMIALLKAAETTPDIMDKINVKIAGEDQNDVQEIVPKEAAEIGKTYLVKDLMEKMIRYSDNNAAGGIQFLTGINDLKEVFENLYVPMVVTPTSKNISKDPTNVEGMTAHQFSFFLRVLYNATYLNKEFSERALRLMTEVDFQEGLVAGVPKHILVAHKFGLLSIKEKNGVVVSRQLHDCGIIYHTASPYILCVMTKSSAALPEIEQFIRDASAIVYQEVSRGTGEGSRRLEEYLVGLLAGKGLG